MLGPSDPLGEVVASPRLTAQCRPKAGPQGLEACSCGPLSRGEGVGEFCCFVEDKLFSVLKNYNCSFAGSGTKKNLKS